MLPDFDGLETGAWIEDVKLGQGQITNRSAWKKLAFVSGVDWVSKSTRMFAWAIPGELAVYDMDGTGRGEVLGSCVTSREWVRQADAGFTRTQTVKLNFKLKKR